MNTQNISANIRSLEESQFKTLCRIYISSLFALALALPFILDGTFRARITRNISESLKSPVQERQLLFDELEKNRVQLSSEDLEGIRPNPSVSLIAVRAAAKHRLDPALVKAVIHVESRSNSVRVSQKGASGVMQLMPATARRLGVKNPNDPTQNIFGGTKYLRHLLDMFDNDVRLALAAYNAGPAKVRQYKGVPPYPETQNYVNKVLSAYRDYRQTYS